MRYLCLALGAVVLGVLLAGGTLAQPNPQQGTVGKKIAALALHDTAGKSWTVAPPGERKATVVIFLGTQCPINNAYLPRLAEIHQTYRDRGVQILGINANVHDSPTDIKTHAQRFKIPFPVLRDVNQRAADLFGAKRTPEAFILDQQGIIRYQGRIDDQFGIGFQRPRPLHHDLTNALDQVLAGKEVTVATTLVAGCLIGRTPKPAEKVSITYSKHVARILQNRCQECHRPGQVAPMSLLTYDDASSWADTIREVIAEKRMPPWHADPAHGQFSNDKRLSKEESDTLLAWIDQGCPKGDDKDLPPPRKFPEGWYIGQPDVVFTMREKFRVVATASKKGLPYKYFIVPTNFKEDVWVQAAECKPGARAVVHHIIIYVVQGGKRPNSEDGIGNGFLVAYAPGDLGVRFPPGAAKKIPKGATLVFQMHYTPNGEEHLDQSSVGLILAKEPPMHEVKTKAIAQRYFLIPPGASDCKVTSSATFKKDAILWGLMPHMHLRGKSFKYELVRPDGSRETLLSVPRYDFNWQASYRLKEPLRIPANSRIECTAYFDNSANNPNNPDPKVWVHWGDQTWEEMMIGFVDYSYLDNPK